MQAGDKRAGSDGVGIGEGLAVGFAKILLKLRVPDGGVTVAEQREDCSGLVLGDRFECDFVRH